MEVRLRGKGIKRGSKMWAGAWSAIIGGPTAKPRTYTQEELIECHANKRRQFHAPLTELASSQSHCNETPFEVKIIWIPLCWSVARTAQRENESPNLFCFFSSSCVALRVCCIRLMFSLYVKIRRKLDCLFDRNEKIKFWVTIGGEHNQIWAHGVPTAREIVLSFSL